MESLAGITPEYLADDFRLLSDVSRHTLQSGTNDFAISHATCPADSQQVWCQELLGC